MKKFSKILSAVLLVALLCTTLAFVVAADEATPTVTSTAVTRDPVKNSCPEVLTATTSSLEGNYLDWLTWVGSSLVVVDGKNTYPAVDPSTLLSLDLVTEANGDSYAALTAPKTASGVHAQFTVSTTQTMPKMSNQHFYVVDMDLATQSFITNSFRITMMHRNSAGGTTDLMSNQLTISSYVPKLGAEWVHLTFVGQIDVALDSEGKVDAANTVNTIHVFANGAYAGSMVGAINNNNLVTKSITPENYDKGNGLYAQGFRVEVPNSLSVTKGESIAIDNYSRRDMTKADAEANGLAAIVAAKGNLKDWAGYTTVSNEGKSLPVFAKIGETEYNNAKALSNALIGNDKIDVEFIGENTVPVVFSCDSTVTTHGFNVKVEGCEGATLDTATEGFIYVDAPFKTPITHTIGSVTDNATAIRYDASDNIMSATISNQYFSGDSNSAHFFQVYNTVIDGDNNPYLTYQTVNPGTPAGGYHTHTNYNINGIDGEAGYIIKAGSLTDGVDTRQYAIFEWDMYTSGSMPYGMYIGLTTRNVRDGSPQGGASVHLDDHQVQDNIRSILPIGEWYHFAMVADIQTNTTYVYINDTLVYTIANGVTNTPANLTSGTGTLYGPRINVYPHPNKAAVTYKAEDMFATDNFYARVLIGADAGNLADVIGSAKLSDWNKSIYDENYGEANYPAIVPIAKVDGVKYTNLNELGKALVSNEAKQIELLTSYNGVLNIRCDAVIETNGLPFVKDVNFTVADGATVTVSGTVVTVSGTPYQPKAIYTLLSGDMGSLSVAVDNSVPGNLLNHPSATLRLPNNATEGANTTGNAYLMPYLVEEDGVSYVALLPSDKVIGGNYTNNPYASFENGGISDGSNKLVNGSYAIIDIDVYTENDFIERMTIYPVSRTTADGGSNRSGVGFYLEDYVDASDGWVHLTYIGDVTTNTGYLFVDGVRVDSIANFTVNRASSDESLYFHGFRVDLAKGRNVNSEQMTGIKNAATRVISNVEDCASIAAAISSGSLAGWSGNIVGYQGNASALATIDGVPYYDVVNASKALNTGSTHTVEFLRDFKGVISSSDGVTLIHHNLGELDVNVNYGVTIDGMRFGSDFRIVETEGTIEYIKMGADTYVGNTSTVEWYDAEFEQVEVIYYPIGSEIVYCGEDYNLKKNYIEGGELHNESWYTDDEDGNPVQATTVVANGTDYYFYIFDNVEATTITVNKDVKYNMSLYANFDVNLYVPVANGVSGTTYTIGGVEHVLYTKSIAANNITSDLVFTIEFVVDSVTYTENVTVCVLDYAKAVLASDYSDAVKRVMMAALDYANEAYAIVNGGSGNSEILDVLGNPDNADYIAEQNTEYGDFDNSQIQDVIDTAQLVIDAEGVSIVLKVNAGYAGNIKVSYNDYKDMNWDIGEFDVNGGEEIKLPIKVYNIAHNINIVAGELEGSYNLGAYVESLVSANADEAELAKALFTYAKVAEAYKNALRNV